MQRLRKHIDRGRDREISDETRAVIEEHLAQAATAEAVLGDFQPVLVVEWVCGALGSLARVLSVLRELVSFRCHGRAPTAPRSLQLQIPGL
jgi:hypothetical protein